MTKEPSHDVAVIDARPLLAALRTVRKGEFGVRLPLDQTGVDGEVAEAFNNVMDSLEGSTNEIDRVSEVVGKEGKISKRASLPGTIGGWARRNDHDRRESTISECPGPLADDGDGRSTKGQAEGDLRTRP